MIPNIDICYESIDKQHFFIQDGGDQEPTFIVESNGEFEVINPHNTPLTFLKTDSCVYDSNDKTRCDCVIYNETTFCFIELKCIKPKNFTKNRQKAEKQLEMTIKDFQNEELLKNKTLEAYVCSNCQVKIDDDFEPITKQPKNSEKKTHFLLNLNTKLYYSTKKEFN